MTQPLLLAVPKGRILAEALPLLARAGVVPEATFADEDSRALRFATQTPGVEMIRAGAFDVATFVAHGAAQLGIVGSDEVPLPYYKLKIGQERIVRAAALPTTILRATQFHTLVGTLLDVTGRLRVLPARKALLQPIDPRDMAAAVAELVASGPAGDARIAGPEILTLAELAEQYGAGRRLPLWIPGAAVRAVTRGALTDPTAPRGRITFGEWVATG